jgi:16S rRNA (guanine527-N7)-methyltransferase
VTEDEARALLVARYDVSRETLERLDRFLAFLREQAEHQNLVSASTLDQMWTRHVLDSAQLLDHVPKASRNWLDLGAGAGFPGLVTAVIGGIPTTLVESRRKRIEFLRAAAEIAAPGIAQVEGMAVEKLPPRRYDVISARAFAPLPRLLELSARFAHSGTVWVLPKGRNAATELEQLGGTWQGDFRIEGSLTDPDSAIIVAVHVERRNTR